ncbi:aspartate aminotransferase family protein [Fusibacter sp. 3D3]|uniref:aspartate aminotransferase family protein n=1 Tax=Fusibacter sp. 3D3 TaxID=1048380 RepID=UPI000857729E|nr:aspartate aminotransferase family protein [Fusibacter sp. 3D3]GAU78305.1 acetylornithine aminotransferase [Fusibacter sp. 3D3]
MVKMKDQIEQGLESIANTYGRFPICFESGEGLYLKDTEGKVYLDFVAGIAVNALGHGDKQYAEVLKNQAASLVHVSNLYWNAQNIKLAQTLTSISGLDKAFFCNSGAEANEAALKFARLYGADEKFEIITMSNSFHGRTMGALALTGQTKYQASFAPLLPGVKYVPFNDSEALKNAIGDQTVAVMVEVIQGEGGIVEITPEFAETISKLCLEKDLLLIVDEVQTGIGRTGQYFGYQNYGLKPDVVSCAKGLGGGFPIGATLVSGKVAQKLTPSCHASTFGGTALASAAANYVLDEIESRKLLDNVNQMGRYLQEQLLILQNQFDVIKAIKGKGLIQGIEIVEALPTGKIVNGAMAKGLLLVGAGHQVIRFVPPLIVAQKHIDEMIGILKSVLEDLSSNK